jgi:hypothetical protein
MRIVKPFFDIHLKRNPRGRLTLPRQAKDNPLPTTPLCNLIVPPSLNGYQHKLAARVARLTRTAFDMGVADKKESHMVSIVSIMASSP